MVNMLEVLYAVTVLCLMVSLVQLIRKRRDSARRFAVVGVVAGLFSILLYWYLRAGA